MDATTQKKPVATREETIKAFINSTQRDKTPLRNVFVQKPRVQAGDDGTRAGPLAAFVHDKRGLLAYLLVVAQASTEPWDVTRPSGAWARALGSAAAKPSAAMTKIWRRLQERRLVAVDRKNRQARITLLREDASGDPYTRPQGGNENENFLQLTDRFWTEGWHETLTVHEIVALLIALHERQGFTLPLERAPLWYGISADFLGKGFQGLREHEVIAINDKWVPDPMGHEGFRRERHYHLQKPFK